MYLSRRELIGAAALVGIGISPVELDRLPRAQVRALRDAVRGRVLVPGNRAYNGARQVFNRRYDGVKPPAVVQVRDVADVRAVVRWAERFDVPLVARAGGHAYNGASTSRNAVVVDVRRLDGVRLRDGVATVGPGARNIDIYAALARHGATIPSGSCPTVGFGGLVTGGGMGLAGRELGLTLDRVRSFDVVTADGRKQRVEGDDDLFWALRGGGGSFGIVTSARLRVRRVRRAAWFRIGYPAAARAEALAAWDDLAPVAPDGLTAIFTLTASGATAFGQFFGSESRLRQIVRPLGGSLTTGTSDYLALQRTLILDAYGGAIGRVAPAATAFVHRNVRFSVQILSYTSIGTARDRVRRARRLIAPHGNGQAYQNYADPDLDGARRAYYGANYERLVDIKTAVDPANRFRPAQGIRPR